MDSINTYHNCNTALHSLRDAVNIYSESPDPESGVTQKNKDLGEIKAHKEKMKRVHGYHLAIPVILPNTDKSKDNQTTTSQNTLRKEFKPKDPSTARRMDEFFNSFAFTESVLKPQNFFADLIDKEMSYSELQSYLGTLSKGLKENVAGSYAVYSPLSGIDSSHYKAIEDSEKKVFTPLAFNYHIQGSISKSTVETLNNRLNELSLNDINTAEKYLLGLSENIESLIQRNSKVFKALSEIYKSNTLDKEVLGGLVEYLTNDKKANNVNDIPTSPQLNVLSESFKKLKEIADYNPPKESLNFKTRAFTGMDLVTEILSLAYRMEKKNSQLKTDYGDMRSLVLNMSDSPNFISMLRHEFNPKWNPLQRLKN